VAQDCGGAGAASGEEAGSLLCCFFDLLDLLGDSLALSLFSLLGSVLVVAFSDFFAGSSAVFFSLLGSVFFEEGLEVSFAGLRLIAGSFGAVDVGGVIGGTGLIWGVLNGLGNGLTVALAAGVAAGTADATGVGAAVVPGAAVAWVVVLFVTSTFSSALKRGAATP
jgi:hypothetical protein